MVFICEEAQSAPGLGLSSFRFLTITFACLAGALGAELIASKGLAAMPRALVFEFASLSLRQHDDVDDFKSIGINNSDPVIVDLDVLIFAICRYDLDHSQRHRI